MIYIAIAIAIPTANLIAEQRIIYRTLITRVQIWILIKISRERMY